MLSLAHPENESVETRVKYFFNGGNVSLGAYKHIREQLMTLGSFSPHYAYTITYTEFDETLNAVKAVVQVERKINNMFKDEPFEDVIDYAIIPDGVGDSETIQGELVYATIQGGETNAPATDLVIQPIAVKDVPFKDKIPLRIHPDGHAIFAMKFWVWHKIGNAYTMSPTRYTDLVSLRVVNKSGLNLSLRWKHSGAVKALTSDAAEQYDQRMVSAGTLQPFVLEGVS